MQRKQNQRRNSLAFGFAAALVAGATLTAPVMAQTTASSATGPFRVMVMDLTHKTDSKSVRFGDRTAEAVRKAISELSTHTAIAEKDVDAQLKALNESKDGFDCIKGRQLAPRLNAAIVMCGDYEPAEGGTQVSATFYGKSGDETIEYGVPAFLATNEADAAQKIVSAFSGYVDQLRQVSFCANNANSEQWEDALRTCTAALALNPKSPPALYGRAVALSKMDKKEEALAGFQQVLAVYPTHMDAMLNAGLVAAQLGQTDVSAKYFKEYLDLNPGDDQVRFMIADKLNTAGDPAGAARQLEQGLAGSTDNYNLMNRIALYYVIAGSNAGKAKNTDEEKAHYAKALVQYEKIIANIDAAKLSKTQSDEVMRYAMLAYTQTGNTAKALETGRIAVTNDSASAETWQRYANSLALSGSLPDARNALVRAAALDPKLQISYQLANFALSTGNLNEAVAMANKAASEGTPQDQIDVFAAQLIAEGAKRDGDGGLAWINAGRQLGKGERVPAMANFYQGAMLYKQATNYVPTAPKVPTASAARTALPIFQRAKSLLLASTAFTEAADSRRTYVNGIDKYIEYLQQIIKG